MGRKPLSDAEKLARGTLDNRTSEVARAKATANKVHAFPTLREIPEPTVPFAEDSVGRKTYDRWARFLFDAGHLTVISQGFVENLAMADQTIAAMALAGKPVPASVLTQRNRALGELKILDVDPSLTPNKPEDNVFRKNGFARRLRASSASRS
jgi:hypothetical protein